MEWLTDILFVVPNFGNVGVTNSWSVKKFLRSVAEKLNIGSEGAHAGLIEYGTFSRTVSPIGETQSLEDFERKLNSFSFEKGQNYIDRALKLASKELFTQNGFGRRDGVPKTVVLLTYDKQTKSVHSDTLFSVAENIKQNGVSVFTLGIGNAVNVKELLKIGSGNNTTFIVEKFTNLPEFSGDLTEAVHDTSSE